MKIGFSQFLVYASHPHYQALVISILADPSTAETYYLKTVIDPIQLGKFVPDVLVELRR